VNPRNERPLMPPKTAKTTALPKAAKATALALTANTTHLELYFLLRVHGGETDKRVTIEKGSSASGQALLPIFGAKDSISKSLYLEFLRRAFEHDATIPVTYQGKVPTDEECWKAASDFVKREITGFDALYAPGFPSKWNPETHRWDPLAAAEIAYGYSIVHPVDAGEGDPEPVDAMVAVGNDTLIVDFIVQVQGTISEGEGDT